MSKHQFNISLLLATSAFLFAGCASTTSEPKAENFIENKGVKLASEPLYEGVFPAPSKNIGVQVSSLRTPSRNSNGVHHLSGNRPYLVITQQAPAIKRVEMPWHITFNFNKSNVDTSQFGLIQQMVQFLNADESRKINLVGYADHFGSSSYNDKIAKERVKAVRKSLVEFGLNRVNQITVSSGAGETTHITNNNNKKESSFNRRVDAFVVGG